MNICFQGTEYELADRYTDCTKILFLTLFYCSIFPSSFFLCSISLALKYIVDRFSLTRTWKKAPHLGPVISKVCRKGFFSSSVAIMAITSSYYWAGFSFDNLCQNDSINTSYVGNNFTIKHQIVDGGFTTETLTFTMDDHDYSYCNMDFLATGTGFTFPFVPALGNERIDPSLYMNHDQLISTTYFGWSSLAILIIVLLKFVVSFYGS